LSGIAVLSDTDVWAVGYSNNGGMIIHWNGKRWRAFENWPSGRSMYGASALGKNDVWALGLDENSSRILLEHWNGKRWTTIAAPVYDAGNMPAMVALAPQDVWVGGSDNANHAVAGLWNGRSWRTFRLKQFGSLYGVAGMGASSPTDVWAVAVNGSLIRWNGRRWSLVRAKGRIFGGVGIAVNGVASVLAEVEIEKGSEKNSTRHPAAEIWSNGKLRLNMLPEPKRTWESELNGAEETRGGAWAVGDYTAFPANTGQDYPLIEHLAYCHR
jgi:hypothetical protein